LEISAIISTYNRARFLPGLFDSIKNQTLPSGNFEVLIINNNSSDNTEELSLSFVNNNSGITVRYYDETNQGLSYARNRGIKEASGELLTFIDDDAILSNDFLENTVEFFDNHPDVGAAGGKILLQFTGEEPSWNNIFLSPLLGYFNYGDKTRPFKNNYFRGSNMTFRSSLFKIHEPFDTRLGRKGDSLTGGEEKELFYRLKSNGVQLWYIADAIVYHLVPDERTSPEFIKNQAYGTGNSKKIHARIGGKNILLKEYLIEISKWIISFFVSFYYIITFRSSKGIMLIKFRYHVSRGLLNGNI